MIVANKRPEDYISLQLITIIKTKMRLSKRKEEIQRKKQLININKTYYMIISTFGQIFTQI